MATPKKLVQFQEIELSSSSMKKLLIFSYISGNTSPKKASDISENLTFLLQKT